ncbi:MAG: acyl-CoA thioesterase [Nitrospira sp.]|nr:acyl-CoA thioesterase [Nitrospira sp.]
MSRFVRPRRIRFSDCDPAGIVFYPQYFVMFNDLVEQWIDDVLQVSHRELVIGRGIGLPTVHLEVDFTAVSRMGDAVSLALEDERIGDRSLGLKLQCTGNGRADDVRMSMRQVVVTTSLRDHRSVAMPADLRAAIERFVAAPGVAG